MLKMKENSKLWFVREFHLCEGTWQKRMAHHGLQPLRRDGTPIDWLTCTSDTSGVDNQQGGRSLDRLLDRSF